MAKVRIGNKIVEIDHYENGVPIIKADAQQIKHPDGRVDVLIKVPCLEIKGKENGKRNLQSL